MAYVEIHAFEYLSADHDQSCHYFIFWHTLPLIKFIILIERIQLIWAKEEFSNP